MKEKTDTPQISQTDLDRPNHDVPGDTDINSYITRHETQQALQANDAEKMTLDEANKLSSDENQ